MSTRASAYVHRGRLCIVGLNENKLGSVPFAVSVPLESKEQDGPVDLEKLTPGLEKALDIGRDKVKNAIGLGQMEIAAENLVLRARQGDQNAMAMISAVSQNAKRGVPRAKHTYKLIKNFVKTNPVKTRSVFGLEQALATTETDFQKCAALATFGPSAKPEKLVCILANHYDVASTVKGLRLALERTLEPCFKLGFALYKSPRRFAEISSRMDSDDYNAAKVGFLAGKALAIQKVRAGAPISILSEVAGWELGE